MASSGAPKGYADYREMLAKAKPEVVAIGKIDDIFAHVGPTEVVKAAGYKGLVIVIDEVETDNWGWGGLPLVEYRKRHAASS